MKPLTHTPEEISDKKKVDKFAVFEQEWNSLTLKQQSVIQILGRKPGIPFITAAREAGYVMGSKSRASAIQKSIEGKLGQSLKDIFGITEFDLLTVFVDAMKAEKTVVVVEKEYYGNGKLKSEKAKIVPLGPDHAVRTKTAMFIAKLGNYEPVTKIKIDHKHKLSVMGVETVAVLKERERTQNALLTECEVEDATPN